MKYIYSDKGEKIKDELKRAIQNFRSEGKPLGPGLRNSLRIFRIKDYTVNIKSFKKPNLVNKVVYKFFRKSKAERSFKNALKLLEANIGTPYPMAFSEDNTKALFGNSYYACSLYSSVRLVNSPI